MEQEQWGGKGQVLGAKWIRLCAKPLLCAWHVKRRIRWLAGNQDLITVLTSIGKDMPDRGWELYVQALTGLCQKNAHVCHSNWFRSLKLHFYPLLSWWELSSFPERARVRAHTPHTQPPSYLAFPCILLIVLSCCFSHYTHYLQVFLSNTQSCKKLQNHREKERETERKKYINFPLKFGLFIYLTHPTILSRTHTFPVPLLDCDLQAR